MLENAVTSVTAMVIQKRSPAWWSRQRGADAQYLQSDRVISDKRPHQHALHSFMSPKSAIIQLPFSHLLQEWAKAQFAHPEIKAMLHAV